MIPDKLKARLVKNRPMTSITLRVPADVVVVTEEQVAKWGTVPGTAIHDALTEGRVLAEA